MRSVVEGSVCKDAVCEIVSGSVTAVVMENLFLQVKRLQSQAPEVDIFALVRKAMKGKQGKLY